MAGRPRPSEDEAGFATPMVVVRDLSIGFAGHEPVVRDVELSIGPGRVCALVGESGAGKSLVAMAMAGLLPQGARATAGALRLAGRDVSSLDEAAWSRLRGRLIGVVFQDPFTALDPLMRVGDHFGEAILAHARAERGAVVRRTHAMLERVGLAPPERVARSYPGALSGGMRQRVQVALALLHDPPIVVADEPTASLDPESRDRTLDLVVGLCRERAASVLLVSHDLGSVRDRADDVAVMVGGRVVEAGKAGAIFGRPRHPFTVALLAAATFSVRQPGASAIRRLPTLDGCRYYDRCPRAQPICGRREPRLTPLSGVQTVACHILDEDAS